ncbi:alkaline/neutral invertase E, chloroplastic-like protein [Tanacetum coccineum]
MGRPEIAANAVNVAERRLASNKWPEYYDTKNLRFIGKQARLFKIWSIAGYVPSKTTSKRQAPITPSIVNKASVALVVVLVTATTVPAQEFLSRLLLQLSWGFFSSVICHVS